MSHGVSGHDFSRAGIRPGKSGLQPLGDALSIVCLSLSGQSIFDSSVNRIHRAPSIVRPLHNGWESTEAGADSKQLERKCSSGRNPASFLQEIERSSPVLQPKSTFPQLQPSMIGFRSRHASRRLSLETPSGDSARSGKRIMDVAMNVVSDRFCIRAAQRHG